MERTDLALTISLLVAAVVACTFILSIRYRKYERAVRRGKPHLKRVWRPFWMN